MLDLARYDPDEQELLREFMRLETALGDLESFRASIEPSGHTDFKYPHAAHHQVMAEAVHELLFGDSHDRLLIISPWGSAKSTILSIQAVLWLHAHKPDELVLAGSATQSLAEEFQRRRISALETEELQRFGLQLDPTRKSAKEYKLKTGGSCVAAGVETSVVGRRAGLLLLDDPVTSFEAAESMTLRNNQWNWYRTVWRSRLKPGGKELIVTTRWHADDIAGRILKGDEADTWRVIRIPMLADTEPDPVGRAVGERLWPEHYRERDIIEAQKDVRTWAGSYQGLPLQDEGDWLDANDLPIIESTDMTGQWATHAAIDIAHTEGAGDYTVILIAKISKDKRMVIVDMWRDRVTGDKIVEQLIRMYKKYKPRQFLIENDTASKTFRDMAHVMLRGKGCPIHMKLVPHRGKDKEVKASAFRGFAKQGTVNLLRGGWNLDFIRECEQFPVGGPGVHDDAVDAAGLLGRHLMKMGGAKATEVRKAMLEPQGFMTEIEGEMYTRSTLNEMYEDRARRSPILSIARRRI